MVRFSDLLGGQESPEDKPVEAAAAASEEVLLPDAAADDVPEPGDVLERLTQYATSARAPDQVPSPETIVEPPNPEPPSPDSEPAPVPDAEPGAGTPLLAPVADDLLPRAKGRKGRS